MRKSPETPCCQTPDMPCHSLQPRSLPDGNFAASWFDDAAFLWNDDRLHKPYSIADAWVPPHLILTRAQATAVLFNPNAIAVSEGLKDELTIFPELELLPVSIRDHGTFFIIHVTTSLDLPPGSKARLAPTPSGNLMELQAFPSDFSPPHAFFRVRHPVTSAAGASGYVSRTVYMNESGARCIRHVCDKFLEATLVPGA